MTYKEIKKSIISILKSLYLNEKVYGIETVKGYTPPCLFVNITPVVTERSVNVKRKICAVEILRMQRTVDEADALDFFERVEDALHPKLVVGDRYLNTSDFQASYMGEDMNVPLIEFSIEFYERVNKEDNAKLMKKVEIREEL